MNGVSNERERIRTFLSSPEFVLFLDDDLRQLASRCAEECREKTDKAIKKSQLHSIPATVQAGGLAQLKDLANNQADKNTREDNKIFWQTFLTFLKRPTGTTEETLISVVERRLGLPDPRTISDKKERKDQVKRNEELCLEVLEKVLPVFCEHFTCHYFYLTREETT